MSLGMLRLRSEGLTPGRLVLRSAYTLLGTVRDGSSLAIAYPTALLFRAADNVWSASTTGSSGGQYTFNLLDNVTLYFVVGVKPWTTDVTTITTDSTRLTTDVTQWDGATTNRLTGT